MQRLYLVAALALVACGVSEDAPGNRRPATIEYVTESVLAPACGNAQCHSSFRNEANYAFDTVENARKSMSPDDNPGVVIPGAPDDSLLIIVLTRTVKRMPYDQPLPEADQAYLRRWIMEGAEGLAQ